MTTVYSVESEMSRQFGIQLRKARLHSGMTQQELADRVGFRNKLTITRLECGKAVTIAPKLYRLAQALGVTPNFLLGFGDVSKPAVEHSESGARLAQLIEICRIAGSSGQICAIGRRVPEPLEEYPLPSEECVSITLFSRHGGSDFITFVGKLTDVTRHLCYDVKPIIVLSACPIERYFRYCSKYELLWSEGELTADCVEE